MDTSASLTPIEPSGTEEWRPIPGFGGRYEVSSHGRIRSLPFVDDRGCKRAGRIRSLVKDGAGYAGVALVGPGGLRKFFQVHALVLAAFRGPRPPGLHSAHRDGNPMNPCLDNLAYVTPTENCAHRAVHGRWRHAPARGEAAGLAVLTDDLVREIRRVRRDEGLSFAKLGARFGHATKTVEYACKEGWRHVI